MRTSRAIDPLAPREQELLRQERATFEQRRQQDREAFALRRAMGWIAVAGVPAIGVLCALIIVLHEAFPAATVGVATSCLLVEVVGLLATVWRASLGPGVGPLAPVARQDDARREDAAGETR